VSSGSCRPSRLFYAPLKLSQTGESKPLRFYVPTCRKMSQSDEGEKESSRHIQLVQDAEEKALEENVRVKPIPGDKVRGLFSEKSFNPGEIIFTEIPLFSKQEYANKQEIRGLKLCGHCFKRIDTSSSKCEPASPYFYCSCGDIFCSSSCQVASDAFHRMVKNCRVSTENFGISGHQDRSICLLESHAVNTNETFMMAADVIVHILDSWICCKSALLERMPESDHEKPCERNASDDIANVSRKHMLDLLKKKKFSQLIEDIASSPSLSSADKVDHRLRDKDERILRKCLLPIDDFVKAPWWEVVEYSSDEMNEVEYRALFKQICEDSLEILSDTLLPYYGESEVISQKLLSIKLFGCIMGMFELNNIGIEFPIDDTETNQSSETEICDSENFEEDDCTWFDGSGLFTVACMMNHSCNPNVSIEFRERNHKAYVVCRRPIEPGEELCVSYIDAADLSTEERQAELKEYGFLCSCELCSADLEITSSS